MQPIFSLVGQPHQSPQEKLPTPNGKLELESRIGDYFVFLRRLFSKNRMGKFLSKPHWIKLILAFLSTKPCNDVETFLNFACDCPLEEEEKRVLSRVPSPENIPGPSSGSQCSGRDEDLCNELRRNKLKASVGCGRDMCRNIVFAATGLRPRLLAVQLLESLLTNLSHDLSDLREQVSRELMQQLSECMWSVPIYERAKRNILNRESICKSIYGIVNLNAL